MEFHLKQRKGRLLASGDMTIYHAAVMKEALLAVTAEIKSDVALDLANVTELDTCGLQILLLLQRQVQASGRTLTITAASPAVREVFALCGLETLCEAA
jgi:anti-anti-sigma factor